MGSKSHTHAQTQVQIQVQIHAELVHTKHLMGCQGHMRMPPEMGAQSTIWARPTAWVLFYFFVSYFYEFIESFFTRGRWR